MTRLGRPGAGADARRAAAAPWRWPSARALTGLRPPLWLIAVGAFGMSLWLTLLNGIYTTIVQVKVPQRFHGRVFAMNTVIAWSTLPVGFGLVAPDAAAAIGLGPTYLLFGAAIAVIALAAMRLRPLARFDVDVPDTEPEDLIGLTESAAAQPEQET